MNFLENIDSYLAHLQDTRKSRATVTFDKVSEEEKQRILENYHPDYRSELFTNLRTGKSKGSKVVKEFSNLVESKSIAEGAKIDKTASITTEVLVIGGGGAGITAAIFAHDQGAEVTLVTKLRLGDSNTIMAQGGMQVSLGKDDSPVQHFVDSMKGGGNINDPYLLRLMVEKAPEAMAWLEEIGIIFSKKEDHELELKKGGGASRARLVYSKDYTGLEMTRNLIGELNKRSIKVIQFSPVAELLTDDQGNCTGAVVIDYDNDHFYTIQAKTVIMATGGSGRLHIGGFPSSNHFGATGDGLVMAYRAGAEVADMDSYQYHPTGVIYPSPMLGLLVTEAIRSEGGHLVNVHGDRFVDETETRDFVAASIIKEVQQGRGIRIDENYAGVWLDIPALEIKHGNDYVRKRFPAMYRQFKRFGWDIRKKPVLIFPTLHYQNGGLRVDVNCETDVKNLFSVGEVIGGLHGRNRLMGNSLIDLFVFGKIAGIQATKRAKEIEFGEMNLNHLAGFRPSSDSKLSSPLLLPDYIRKDF
jgi:succinate dehydrogenase / fumarate reductase flavoprotein subunit/L-aspartate oxidase